MSERRWETVYRQVLYPNVRGGWEHLGTHSEDLYLKFRGEVGDTVQTLRTSI